MMQYRKTDQRAGEPMYLINRDSSPTMNSRSQSDTLDKNFYNSLAEQ